MDTFVGWFNEDDTVRDLALRGPMGRAAEERWLDGALERQGKSDYLLVICLMDDGRAIGTVGLHRIDLDSGNAEFGIVIGAEADRNRGFGTDALNAICEFGFGELRLERIYLNVLAGNARGRRSYEKAGFVLEGTQRRAQFTRGGFEDVHRMALLRAEWLDRRAAVSGEKDR